MSIYDYHGNKTKEIKVPWASSSHRGKTSNTIPENTIPALYEAWRNGADWIETDVRTTSDGVYVLSHDATITGTVNGVSTTYTIASETYSTLQGLLLGTDATYGGIHIGKLEDALKLCLYTGMRANLDCKVITASTLATLVVNTGMSGKCSYANTTTSKATDIITVDANAGFIFPYADLSTWNDFLIKAENRRNSFAWGSPITTEKLESVKAAGFKYLLNGVTTIGSLLCIPDMIEFNSTVDIEAANKAYLDSVMTILS